MSSPAPGSDPVLNALAAIDTRLGAIDARLASLEARSAPAFDLFEQGPAAVGTAIDIADDVARRLGDVEERLQAALSVAEKATAPHTLRQLEEALGLVEQVPGLVATGIDIADAAFERVHAGVDVARLVPALESLTFFWGRTLTSPATTSLLASTEAASALLQAATTAVQKTVQAPATPTSTWGLLRALSDPDVQRAMGVLLTFARAFGEGMASASTRARPSQTTALPPSTTSSPSRASR